MGKKVEAELRNLLAFCCDLNFLRFLFSCCQHLTLRATNPTPMADPTARPDIPVFLDEGVRTDDLTDTHTRALRHHAQKQRQVTFTTAVDHGCYPDEFSDAVTEAVAPAGRPAHNDNPYDFYSGTPPLDGGGREGPERAPPTWHLYAEQPSRAVKQWPARYNPSAWASRALRDCRAGRLVYDALEAQVVVADRRAFPATLAQVATFAADRAIAHRRHHQGVASQSSAEAAHATELGASTDVPCFWRTWLHARPYHTAPDADVDHKLYLPTPTPHVFGYSGTYTNAFNLGGPVAVGPQTHADLRWTREFEADPGAYVDEVLEGIPLIAFQLVHTLAVLQARFPGFFHGSLWRSCMLAQQHAGDPTASRTGAPDGEASRAAVAPRRLYHWADRPTLAHGGRFLPTWSVWCPQIVHWDTARWGQPPTDVSATAAHVDVAGIAWFCLSQVYLTLVPQHTAAKAAAQAPDAWAHLFRLTPMEMAATVSAAVEERYGGPEALRHRFPALAGFFAFCQAVLADAAWEHAPTRRLAVHAGREASLRLRTWDDVTGLLSALVDRFQVTRDVRQSDDAWRDLYAAAQHNARGVGAATPTPPAQVHTTALPCWSRPVQESVPSHRRRDATGKDAAFDDEEVWIDPSSGRAADSGTAAGQTFSLRHSTDACGVFWRLFSS